MNEQEANASYWRHPRGSWVNHLGVIPWALHPSGGWNVRGISGWFRMCFRAVTCWPYVVFLYIESTRMTFRNCSFAHIWGLCKTITWYLFSCLPDGNRAVTSNSAGLIPVFDYKSKKRFGLPPMKAHGWNFCWKSPLAPRWNPMLGYPLQCGNLSVYAPRAKQWCHYRCNFTKWKQNIQCPFWFLLSGITWYWPFDSWQPVVFTSIGKCNFSLRNLILIFRWHAGFD